ncbi:TVP38/TMEM64 family protein [Haloplanus pelagicus]|uniref:TVP38/TMEM64 family protein n=1 Tax=Haloplanus pelagicus TaxID=2949995 RepID=UPI00203EDE86|nr:TVP38/TMEM64 family protein [Haloplanus sp. HW8-1]
MRVFASAEARRQFVVHALLAALVVAGVTVVLGDRLSLLTDAAAVRAYVRGFGIWAPVVLIGLQTLQVVLAPIPGQVLGVVAGYLFGPWWGTLFNMIGIGLGSALAFWLSRRFGRTYVERTIHAEVLDRFDAIVDRGGLSALFVLFLVPGLPDDALCFVGGLTPIPLRRLVLVAVVGRAPAFFLVNVFGGLVADGDLPAAGALFVVVTVLSLAGYLYRRRLVALLDGTR